MKRVINIIILLICLLSVPIYCYAENDVFQVKNTSTYVKVLAPAKVLFKNEDKIIKREVEVGQKLDEPSHLEIAGYIFNGWYDGQHKWDFENDVVTDHLTLISKYTAIDDYTINVRLDKKSIMQPSIQNVADLKAEFVDINAEVDIILEVKDAKDLITESEKQKFERKFEQEKMTLGKYLNMSLFMELNKDPMTRETIHETKHKIKIQLTVPKDIRFKNKKYYIVRLHDGILETIYEGFPSKHWKLAFETDKFSLYAIAYSYDNYTNPNINPMTGDNIVLWMNLMIVSMAGVILIIVYTKK